MARRFAVTAAAHDAGGVKMPELKTDQILDMLLAKKRSPDRKVWLQEKGDLAEIQ